MLTGDAVERLSPFLPPPSITTPRRVRPYSEREPAYDVYPVGSISPHKLLTRILDVHVVY